MFFLTGAGGSPATGYQISRSLRFNDDDSAYLSRTPAGASNRDLWTLSVWVKRGNLGGDQALISVGADTNNHTTIRISNNAGSRTDQIDWVTLSGGSIVQRLTTSQLFRDPSSWYHLVFVYDSANATADNRQIVYVNGQQVTAFGTRTNPSSGQDLFVNNNTEHMIGRYRVSASEYFDGYMAEIHFVDGTALTPSSFGETDATTGVWKPKRASGITYGTNGFYLSFADNTSTTTLGYDDAGSNDWTLNNFSVTAGAGNDSLIDTPTNNFCTWNSINKGSSLTLSNGNLDVASTATITYVSTTIAVPKSTPVYLEFTNASAYPILGIMPETDGLTNYPGQTSGSFGFASSNGQKYNNASGAAYGSTLAASDVMMLAVDQANGKIWWGKNGTWFSSGDPAAGTNAGFTTVSTTAQYNICVSTNGNVASMGSANFGQRPFAYTPPTGFSALCTANLPTPTIRKPSVHFNAVTYTGTGSSLAITGVGHQPDLVWIKSRSAATDHALYDAVRGVQARLESNQVDAEATSDNGLTAFGSDGFTVNTLAQVNTNTATYVGWCWKEGVTPGFDIVSYTGDNTSNRNINHSLGAAPHFAIIKDRSNAEDWFVYHRSLSGATSFLTLNGTAAQSTTNTPWGTGNWSSTQFMVTNNATNNANANSANLIAYLFTEIAGFSRFGSYTGNGSADGPFVWCGFRPRFILYKNASAASNSWLIHDAARNSSNLTNNSVAANVANSENDAAISSSTENTADLLSNGFKLRSINAQNNGSGNTIVFAAFAESPFKYALAR